MHRETTKAKCFAEKIDIATQETDLGPRELLVTFAFDQVKIKVLENGSGLSQRL
jgi:hypothetical protein